MKLTSPFEKYPGEIVVPEELDAEQFNAWWLRSNELDEAAEEESRYPLFEVWECRFPFIQSHSIKLPEEYELEQTGLKLPTPAFAEWFIQETNFLLDQATNLKNYLGLSDDTSDTEKTTAQDQ